MKNTILKSMLIGASLLLAGGHLAYSANDDEQERTPQRPVEKSQKEKDADATPGDVKKFFGKAHEAKEHVEERADKAGPMLKDAGQALEKAISTMAGRRDDKDDDK